MATYIVPNSDVKLLHGVPIDTSYTHTLYFPNDTQQQNYFLSKVKYSFAKVSYVRNSKGVIKLQISADNIRDCNYMMFRNTAYSNKWFYAFITAIDYVSNATSMVQFVIDPLQTWLFDMQLGQCYIERQHSETDVPGDNLIPEGLETGDYMYLDNDLDWSKTFTGYDVVVYATFKGAWISNHWVFDRQQGDYRWGIYTGLNIRVFRNIEQQATIDSLNSFITQATETYGEENGIVAMIMIPSNSLDNNNLPVQELHTVPKITSIDGYTPRNKKLLTYPYVFIEGQNCEGAVAVFPQEYFASGGGSNTVCNFMVTYNITVAPCAVCIPLYYKRSDINYAEALYINNFSQCSYNTDLFKAYMAQSLTAKIGQDAIDMIGSYINPWKNSGNTGRMQQGFNNAMDAWQSAVDSNGAISDTTRAVLNYPGTSVLTLAGGITAALSGNAGEIFNTIFTSMAQAYEKSVAAPHNTGGNTPDYLTSNRLKGFWFFHRVIRPEFARKIDQFFDRFGYAQHKIDTPNIRARNRWTYVKTVDCMVHGNIPADAIATIQSIFDGGITWWADTDNVGNYSLLNNIYVAGGTISG